MYAVVITDEGGAQRRLDFSKPELTVGRVNGNDIVLAKRNVSKQHARLSLDDEKAVVVDLNSTNGTWVNGRKITAPHPLKSGDKIYIADFIITLEEDGTATKGSVVPEGLSEPPPPRSKAPSRSLSPKTSRPARSALPPRGRTSRLQDSCSREECLDSLVAGVAVVSAIENASWSRERFPAINSPISPTERNWTPISIRPRP